MGYLGNSSCKRTIRKSLRLTGNATIYVDTDSNKCVGVESNVLEKLNMEIKKEAVTHNAYVDFDGKRYYMGVLRRKTLVTNLLQKGRKNTHIVKMASLALQYLEFLKF